MSIVDHFRARINADAAMLNEMSKLRGKMSALFIPAEVVAVLDDETYDYALDILMKLDKLDAIITRTPSGLWPDVPVVLVRHGHQVQRVSVN